MPNYYDPNSKRFNPEVSPEAKRLRRENDLSDLKRQQAELMFMENLSDTSEETEYANQI